MQKLMAKRKARQPRVRVDLLDDWHAAMDQLDLDLQARPKKDRGYPPFDNWSGRLRRSIYALVRRYQRQNRLRIISEVVASMDREPINVSFKENPYYWALYAARQEFDPEIEIKDWEISRFSMQMVYAAKHDIDPELLIGFIYQQGNYGALRDKLRKNAQEPWVKDRLKRLEAERWGYDKW